MPSPRNQCGENPGLGFEPFRTYRPESSGGSVPSTCRSNASVSRVTGAKSPRSHHGFDRSTTVVDVGAPAIDAVAGRHARTRRGRLAPARGEQARAAEARGRERAEAQQRAPVDLTAQVVHAGIVTDQRACTASARTSGTRPARRPSSGRRGHTATSRRPSWWSRRWSASQCSTIRMRPRRRSSGWLSHRRREVVFELVPVASDDDEHVGRARVGSLDRLARHLGPRLVRGRDALDVLVRAPPDLGARVRVAGDVDGRTGRAESGRDELRERPAAQPGDAGPVDDADAHGSGIDERRQERLRRREAREPEEERACFGIFRDHTVVVARIRGPRDRGHLDVGRTQPAEGPHE